MLRTTQGSYVSSCLYVHLKEFISLTLMQDALNNIPDPYLKPFGFHQLCLSGIIVLIIWPGCYLCVTVSMASASICPIYESQMTW